MSANEILTLPCLYLCLWSEGSSERPKMQGTSVGGGQAVSCYATTIVIPTSDTMHEHYAYPVHPPQLQLCLSSTTCCTAN